MICKTQYASCVLACTLLIGTSASHAQDGMMTGWHSIYAPVGNLERFSNAEIVVANKAAEAENIAVVLYGAHGKKMHETPIQMKASETKRLSVASLMELNGRQDIGGLEILYYGMDMDIVAQISLKNDGNTGSVDVPMFEDMEFMSNNREAVWWVPSGSHSTIIVGNSGDTELNVQLSRSLSDKQLHLKAHETQLIEAGQGETDSGIQSVRLTSDGMPGQLRAAGFVRDREWGRLQTIRYTDPASSMSGHLFANGVPFDGRDLSSFGDQHE